MRYFLSGGSKSGKSMLGQRLARDMAAGGPLYYIATMIPRDEEDQARIRRHLQERAWREENGRMMRMLAQHAKRVIRIWYGLPQVLK